jgi:hypothetical protein
VEWTEKPLFGGPPGYAASSSEAFRTVSEGVFSEVRLHDPAWIVFERPETSPIAALPGSRQDLHLVVVDKNAENRDIR